MNEATPERQSSQEPAENMASVPLGGEVKMVVGAYGSNVERWMSSEEIRAFKEQIRDDEGLRAELAARHVANVHTEYNEGLNPADDEAIFKTARFAVSVALLLQYIGTVEEDWPAHVSPPEYFAELRHQVEESEVAWKQRSEEDDLLYEGEVQPYYDAWGIED